MSVSIEDRLIVLLLGHGTVSLQDLREMEEDLTQARTLVMAGAGEQRRIAWLLQRGKITREDLEAVQGGPQAAPAPARPAAPDRSTGDRPARSRYKVIQLLGEGGMGKVYKAHDVKLDRYLALKFLHASDPEMIQRFLREAQSQARIEHPAICKVYEVGEMDNRPYIAMQYIDGRTLKAARSEMTLEQKVQVVRTAAEAVHEAHRIGIIHRDLNPSNIMVERSEAGVWMPYLMDFGLAKEMAGPGLTQDGTTAGTPFYMSPEQAAGDIQKLDRRTDVYALGATLYELAAGMPPFSGATVIDVLDKVIHEEAVPLRKRDANLPEDLESIVMKCLEKEPQRRYDSARALAEDLGRFLDGEPVQAKPASLLYRLRKKAEKNKLAVGIGGAALLALLALSALWLGERLAARERAALAQRFGAEAQELESVLRYAHMLPLHDITPQKGQVEARMASLRERMEALGRVARGPGLYALGRGHLALDRPEEAAASLQAAWDAGYREPVAASALGRALGRAYQNRLPDAEGILNRELREAKLRELEARYRKPALEYLRAGTGASTDAPEYAEALLALLARQWDRALELAHRAQERIPWLYEARRLEGEVHAARARSAEAEGRFEEASADYAMARAAFEGALAVAPSDPALYEALADLYASRMRMEAVQGRPVEEAYLSAVGAVGRALEADPGRASAHDALAFAEWYWGTTLRRAGKDPVPAYDRAEAAARRALALAPDNAGTLNRLGLSFVSRGEWIWDNGGDPVPAFQEALRHYQRAARLEPGNIVVLNNLGNAHTLWGDCLRFRGEDPVPHLKRAVEAYQAALAIHPETSYLLNNLGNAWATIGTHRMDRGEDPLTALEEAERSHREAVRINPRYASAWSNLGYDLADRSRWAAKAGGDPVALLMKALEAFEAAKSANPSSSGAYLNAANCHLDWADWVLDRGGDPQGHIREAERLLARSLELNATDTYARTSEGLCSHLEALWEIAQGGDPVPLLLKAERRCSKVVSIDPTYATAVSRRGMVRLDLALAAGGRASGGGKPFAAAEADLRKALDLNPNHALAHAALARVLLAAGGDPRGEAKALAERGRALDPLESEAALGLAEVLAAGGDFDGARSVLAEALERRPASIKLLLAVAGVEAGRIAAKAEDNAGARREGMEALGKALEAFPRHPRALSLRRSLESER